MGVNKVDTLEAKKTHEYTDEMLDLLERIRLGRINCNEFIDEKQCVYAKHFLGKKLASLAEVWICRDCVVAVVKGNSSEESYLIERDSDSGLLFVRKVVFTDEMRMVAKTSARKRNVKREYNVYEAKDGFKEWILGYDYDINESSYTIGNLGYYPTLYRVQGDVVVSIQSDIQSLAKNEEVAKALKRASSIASKLAVADLVVAVLTEHDIGIDEVFIPDIDPITAQANRDGWTQWTPRIGIPTTFEMNDQRINNATLDIADLLVEEFGKYFGIEFTRFDGLVFRSKDVIVAEPTQPSARTILTITPGNNYITIYVEGAPTTLQSHVEDTVYKVLFNYLREDNAVDTMLSIGRHLVVLKRVKPAMISVNTSHLFNIRYLNDRNIEIFLAPPPSFIVNKDTEISFRHVQYKEKTLRFSGEFLVSITHIRTVHDYVAEMNTVVLSKFLRKT